ncbi:IS110 family RNA-guided transposase [Limnoglobus roseus]|uniref:IS110 family transposase n=1 Tax=Limnoglobus roseus TaxID=2598579 RepID=A0A5C1A4X6_9BACT|nr:IS110 family transposase [Limnoglobus roseus]QEL14161.1 IS110 family transposase [Limnoglobus roseus]
MEAVNAYVGLDVHKDTIAVAIADAGRGSEVRFWGTVANDGDHLEKLARQLAAKHLRLEFVYEAGPCGYDVYRRLIAVGFACVVVAPSRIPRKPGDRVKNDHRDAVSLARLARAGELTAIWVPDGVHEAMRDVVRARHAANKDLKTARQRIQSYLLKYHMIYPGKAWTGRHLVWLANRRFEHAAQQIAFQGYVNGMEQAAARRSDVEAQIRQLLPEWSLAGVVDGLQSLRGVALIVAVSVVAEVGDLARFDSPKQLMAFLGLVPGEHSSGRTIRPRGITKTGNVGVRRLLFEAAWSYRQTPKVGAYKRQHMPKDIPQAAKDIAWKAQQRLCKRYRQLLGRGKKPQVAITAVARELLGFMWAIAGVIAAPSRPTVAAPV